MTEELSSRALRPLARVIDDEETVRNSTVFTLRVAGIEAVAYESAAAFLENDDIRTRLRDSRRAYARYERTGTSGRNVAPRH